MNLAVNALTGAVPPELGRLTNLDTFYLNDNETVGDYPSELPAVIWIELFWIPE